MSHQQNRPWLVALCLIFCLFSSSYVHAELRELEVRDHNNLTFVIEDTETRTLWWPYMGKDSRKSGYVAPSYCSGLTALGFSDWDVPSSDRLTDFLSKAHQHQPRGDYYDDAQWTSTFERTWGGTNYYYVAWLDRSGGVQTQGYSKDDVFRVRCFYQPPNYHIDGYASAPTFLDDYLSLTTIKEGEEIRVWSYWKDIDDPLVGVKVAYRIKNSGNNWIEKEMSKGFGHSQSKIQYYTSFRVDQQGTYEVKFIASSQDGVHIGQYDGVGNGKTFTVLKNGVTSPEFMSGNASYTGMYANQDIPFYARWKDTDGEPHIFNAQMRYRKQGGAWSAIYDMPQKEIKSDYTEFRTSVFINGSVGTYEVQFRASSSADSDYSEAKQSDWSPVIPSTFELRGVEAPLFNHADATTDNQKITFTSYWDKAVVDQPITGVKVRYQFNNTGFTTLDMASQAGGSYTVQIPFVAGSLAYQFQATSASSDGIKTATSDWSPLQYREWSAPNQAPSLPTISLAGVTKGSGADNYITTYHVSATDPDGDKLHLHCTFTGGNTANHTFRNVASGSTNKKGIGYVTAGTKQVSCYAEDVLGNKSGETAQRFNIDVETSQFTVNLTTHGQGTVQSSPAGIQCGNDCNHTYDENTRLTLTATPDQNATFEGWSGTGVNHCSGNVCEVVVTKDLAITTTFTSITPSVTTVTPTTVTFEESSTFTITGTNLPNTLAAHIDDCADLTFTHRSITQQTFTCTPRYTAGTKNYVVKDRSGGNTLKSGTITVQQTFIPPEVTNFSPTTVTLNEPTTFTITGENLPDTLVVWIDQCVGLGSNGLIIVNHDSNTQKTFQCTPSYSTGSKRFEIKGQSGGNLLYSGYISIQPEPLETLYEERAELEDQINKKKAELETLEENQNNTISNNEVVLAESEFLNEVMAQLSEDFHSSASSDPNLENSIWKEGAYQVKTTAEGLPRYEYSILYEEDIFKTFKYLLNPHTIYVEYGSSLAEGSQEGKNYPAVIWVEFHDSILATGQPLTTPRFIVENYTDLKKTIEEIEASFLTSNMVKRFISGDTDACSTFYANHSLVIKASCAYYKEKPVIDQALQATINEIMAEMDDLSPEEKENAIRFITSLSVDMIPIVGSVKSAGQFVYGKDLITGEDVFRVWELVGIIPYAKIAIKAKYVGIGLSTSYVVLHHFSKNYRKFKGTQRASLGVAKRVDYSKTFYEHYPDAKGLVAQVHHAIPQRLVTGKDEFFHGIITKEELHSIENLRGIKKGDETMHRQITKKWDVFLKYYRTELVRKPTKNELLDFATEIDNDYGKRFYPIIR